MAHPALAALEHRPWPLPRGPWVLAMRWSELLFAHWPIERARLEPLLPAGLELDTFEGQAWLGIVPFRMSGVRGRGLPRIPGAHAFPELNVRTYVKRRGARPGDAAAAHAGVWFLSLDAASALAVAGARASFHLPYFRAAMHCRRAGEWVEYASRRTQRGAPRAELRARYRPIGARFAARAGTLEHWLSERYCLYAARGARTLLCGEIHHARWPLQRAEAEFECNQMATAHGIALPALAPQLLYADELEVVAWAPRRC